MGVRVDDTSSSPFDRTAAAAPDGMVRSATVDRGAVVPRMVGRYAIFDEIASGGMATVYLGRLTGSGGFSRTVAIKRLHPQFAKDPEFVTMFLDEARLAARIRHPNVVPTLDVVAASGELFHVMEFVQGESLSHLARGLKSRGERVPLRILLRIMNDVLQGLHAAHEARDERGVPLCIVHRDVTPQNILVGVDGVARLLDFGVAKAAGRAHTTQDGQIKGKLAYMAPEQLLSSGVTRETDVYAASVVLWEMLTGERLFTGENELDVVAKLLQRDIRPPSRIAPDVPPVLDALVMRGLDSQTKQRFGSAREMCLALTACGINEATSLEVGEWVERLAAQAIADRSARVAVIESQTELSSSVALRPAAPAPAGEPTVVDRPQAAVRSAPRIADGPLKVLTPESSADMTGATALRGVLRARTRRRLGTALALLVFALLGGAIALVRGARPRVVPAPPLSVASAAAPRSPVPAPPDPGTVSFAAAPTEPTGATQEAPIETQAPARRNDAPPATSGRRPAAGTRGGPTPRRHDNSDSVFETRE
jgi:serine/threonine-protein kinase